MPKRRKLMKTKQPIDDESVEVKPDDAEMDEEDDLVEDETIHCTFNNPGWADVISKILNKQPKLQSNQESCILTKATKDYELIETEQTRRTEKERREWENLNLHKPNVNDRERERKLAAIATRGVVQLFNTISEQKEQRRKK